MKKPIIQTLVESAGLTMFNVGDSSGSYDYICVGGSNAFDILRKLMLQYLAAPDFTPEEKEELFTALKAPSVRTDCVLFPFRRR